jgi:hypothetical protein
MRLVVHSVKETRGPKAKLRLVDEFLMVLMRLRLGLLVKDLEYRFKIAASSVSRIFNKWITFMAKVMRRCYATCSSNKSGFDSLQMKASAQISRYNPR